MVNATINIFLLSLFSLTVTTFAQTGRSGQSPSRAHDVVPARRPDATGPATRAAGMAGRSAASTRGSLSDSHGESLARSLVRVISQDTTLVSGSSRRESFQNPHLIRSISLEIRNNEWVLVVEHAGSPENLLEIRGIERVQGHLRQAGLREPFNPGLLYRRVTSRFAGNERYTDELARFAMDDFAVRARRSTASPETPIETDTTLTVRVDRTTGLPNQTGEVSIDILVRSRGRAGEVFPDTVTWQRSRPHEASLGQQQRAAFDTFLLLAGRTNRLGPAREIASPRAQHIVLSHDFFAPIASEARRAVPGEAALVQVTIVPDSTLGSGGYIRVVYSGEEGERTLRLSEDAARRLLGETFRIHELHSPLVVYSLSGDMSGRADDPVRDNSARQRQGALIGAISREITRTPELLPETANNPDLVALMARPDGFRSIQFVEGDESVEIHLEHHLRPTKPVIFRGERVRRLLAEAGIETLPERLSQEFSTFSFSNNHPILLSQPQLEVARDNAIESFQNAARTRSQPTTAIARIQALQPSNEVNVTRRTLIRIDPRTGLPTEGGTEVEVQVRVGGGIGDRHATEIEWTRVAGSGPHLEGAAAENFNRVLTSLGRRSSPAMRLEQERSVVTQIVRELVEQEQVACAPLLGQNPYFQMLTWPSDSGQSLHCNSLQRSIVHDDTRVIARLPVPGTPTLWSAMTREGREHFVQELQRQFNQGKYHLRNPGTIPADTTTGFRPAAVLAQASRGLTCGECRLAASSLGALLGEYGIPSSDLRLVSSHSHIWIEYRTSAEGPWLEADPTARDGRNGSRPNRERYKGETITVIEDFLTPLNISGGRQRPIGWRFLPDGTPTGVSAEPRNLLDPKFRERLVQIESPEMNWFISDHIDAKTLLESPAAAPLLSDSQQLILWFAPQSHSGVAPHDFLRQLVRSNRLREVTDLELYYSQVRGEELAEILSSPKFKELSRLTLSGSEEMLGNLSPEGIARLVRAHRFEWLRLHHQPIGSEGLIRLLENLNGNHLRVLSVDGCQIRDDGALALVRSAQFPYLRSIDLSGNPLTERGITQFLDIMEQTTPKSQVDLQFAPEAVRAQLAPKLPKVILDRSQLSILQQIRIKNSPVLRDRFELR